MTWLSYPSWLNAGDNAWQMTAATFVGLMSLPGLAVLYGGVMQKRWSVNGHADAHVHGVLCDARSPGACGHSRWASDNPIAHSGSGIFGTKGFLGTMVGEPEASSATSARRARRSFRRSRIGTRSLPTP